MNKYQPIEVIELEELQFKVGDRVHHYAVGDIILGTDTETFIKRLTYRTFGAEQAHYCNIHRTDGLIERIFNIEKVVYKTKMS